MQVIKINKHIKRDLLVTYTAKEDLVGYLCVYTCAIESCKRPRLNLLDPFTFQCAGQ